MVADGRLTDWISLGVLASAVPRDAVDDAVEVAGGQGRQAGRREAAAARHGVLRDGPGIVRR